MHSGPTLVHHGLAAALALGLVFGAAPRVAAAQSAHGSHQHGTGTAHQHGTDTEHQHGAGHQHDPSHHAEHHGNSPIVIAIHGGAGTIRRGSMTPEMEQAYRAKLEEALRAGYAVLQQGGTSLDAVVAAITILEDSPLFNAGKGAVFTNAGTNELDAAIMDGATLRAGAVAGVKTVKNPILLARAVMEKSPHVMLAGAGAEAFAAEQGIELVDPSYFFTESRWEALQRAKAQEENRPVLREDEEGAAETDAGAQALGAAGDRGLGAAGAAPASGAADVAFPDDHKFGTVGAVALDRHGNLAAGTSTGGMTNKRWGRIGDSPIIGAGTYASNECVAVSATGHGEYFIRNVVAYDICARMRFLGLSLQEAADQVVMQRLVEQGGEGGVIAIDRQGNIAMPFNTEGMYRGYIDRDGNLVVKIYKD